MYSEFYFKLRGRERMYDPLFCPFEFYFGLNLAWMLTTRVLASVCYCVGSVLLSAVYCVCMRPRRLMRTLRLHLTDWLSFVSVRRFKSYLS